MILLSLEFLCLLHLLTFVAVGSEVAAFWTTALAIQAAYIIVMSTDAA